MREDAHRIAVLVAEQEFKLAVLQGLEAGGVAKHAAELQILRRGERFEHRPLIEQLHLDELGPRQDLEAGVELVVLHKADGGGQLMDQLLDP